MEQNFTTRAFLEYTKNLSEPWFSLIKLGLKKVEGRLIKGDFENIQKNDRILFNNNELGFTREFLVKITSIKIYKTFMEYLDKEQLNKCLPGIDTIEEGLLVYHKYFSEADEEKYGIVAIRMKKIKN